MADDDLTASSAFGLNTYAYALGNPLGVPDPSGLDGVGIIGGVNVDTGLGILRLGGSGSGGLGFFTGNGGHWGAFGSLGSFAGSPSGGVTAPPAAMTGDSNFVAGAYAGAGLGLFWTNANNASDLQGPFDTVTFSTPVGSIQISWSGNNVIVVGLRVAELIRQVSIS